jgi:hypothetical protein
MNTLMITDLNHFVLSSEGNEDLGRAFETHKMTETEKVTGKHPNFIVTTRMSERELRYLLESYFGGEGAFTLSIAPR